MRPSEVLEQDGWCQGQGSDDSKHRCLIHSVGYALPFYPEIEDFLTRAARVLGLEGWHGLTQWNDAPERTKEEVIALLKEVEAEVYGIEHPVPWAEKGLAYASIHSRAD